MNDWLRDPRTEQAEVDAFEAERAERQGDFTGARELYRAAAQAFAGVALSVPGHYANTRSDLAIAAVACFARAGDLGRAMELGQRMLAEGDALSAYGHIELERLVRDYATTLAALEPPATMPRGNRGDAVRDDVRRRYAA